MNSKTHITPQGDSNHLPSVAPETPVEANESVSQAPSGAQGGEVREASISSLNSGVDSHPHLNPNKADDAQVPKTAEGHKAQKSNEEHAYTSGANHTCGEGLTCLQKPSQNYFHENTNDTEPKNTHAPPDDVLRYRASPSAHAQQQNGHLHPCAIEQKANAIPVKEGVGEKSSAVTGERVSATSFTYHSAPCGESSSIVSTLRSNVDLERESNALGVGKHIAPFFSRKSNKYKDILSFIWNKDAPDEIIQLSSDSIGRFASVNTSESYESSRSSTESTGVAQNKRDQKAQETKPSPPKQSARPLTDLYAPLCISTVLAFFEHKPDVMIQLFEFYLKRHEELNGDPKANKGVLTHACKEFRDSLKNLYDPRIRPQRAEETLKVLLGDIDSARVVLFPDGVPNSVLQEAERKLSSNRINMFWFSNLEQAVKNRKCCPKEVVSILKCIKEYPNSLVCLRFSAEGKAKTALRAFLYCVTH